MLRFFCAIFKIKYETCQSCQTLKEQLEYERRRVEELTVTLLNIVKPTVIESAPVELEPIKQTSAIFSRRRAALEEEDRRTAALKRTSPNFATPDNPESSAIDELENQLGIR